MLPTFKNTYSNELPNQSISFQEHSVFVHQYFILCKRIAADVDVNIHHILAMFKRQLHSVSMFILTLMFLLVKKKKQTEFGSLLQCTTHICCMTLTFSLYMRTVNDWKKCSLPIKDCMFLLGSERSHTQPFERHNATDRKS